MKKILPHLMLLSISIFICQNILAQAVPFTSDRWDINASGAIIDGYQGEENALLLQDGSATIKDADFLNGIIEFDIYLANRRGFPGILWRIVDGANYEEFYLRPHQSSNPDAMQYTPVFNGLNGWQLYHDQGAAVQDGRITWRMEGNTGYNTIYTYPFDRWLHVKLVVAGTRTDVYFDRSDTPTLQIRELLRAPAAGAISLRTFTSPVYFANFSFEKTENPPLSPLTESSREPVAHTVNQWQVSNAFKADELGEGHQLNATFVNSQSWNKLQCNRNGLGNIAQVTPREDRSLNTVLAKTTITSEGAQTKRLDFGYSDRVKVYCNGQLLYAGNNGFRTRDYRYLGTIGYFDSVYLPLKNGKNEIVFAVSESFGGWGIQAKLENMTKISSLE
ncbi:MAG: hypothetical protein AAFZ15_26055 [Bacteroidota bacterium]